MGARSLGARRVRRGRGGRGGPYHWAVLARANSAAGGPGAAALSLFYAPAEPQLARAAGAAPVRLRAAIKQGPSGRGAGAGRGGAGRCPRLRLPATP